MRTLRGWIIRLSGLFGKQRREPEMSEEIQSHLEMHVTDNIRAGMTAGQARREALLKLGGLETMKEEYRARGTVPILEHLAVDFRFAVRQLRKSPAFTGAAMVVLALGVCANIAIFAFVDAVLIKPLPYPDPASLVLVTERGPLGRANLSYLDYRDWKRFNTTLRSLDVYTGGGFLFNTPSGAEPVPAGNVSGGFFQTLGIRPLLGRSFLSGEEAHGEASLVRLGYRAWQER